MFAVFHVGMYACVAKESQPCPSCVLKAYSGADFPCPRLYAGLVSLCVRRNKDSKDLISDFAGVL